MPSVLNYDNFVAECRMLINQNEHDICLSYAAAYQRNEAICQELNSTDEKSKCLVWIENIKTDKVNQ